MEAALYASSKKKAKLHFTISEKHKHKFTEEFAKIKNDVAEKTETKFDVLFSFQKETTDTIAVTLKNKPLRDEAGSLVFRASGHGALLDNLKDVNADIVFIKNIDNVVTQKHQEEGSRYKKLLGGVLLKTQEQAFKYQELVDKKDVDTDDIIKFRNFYLLK